MRTTTSSNSNEIHSQTNGSTNSATIPQNAQSNNSLSIPVNKRTTTSSNSNEIHSQTNGSTNSATIPKNAQFKKLTTLDNKPPSFFEPTPRLEMIDSLLEALSAKWDNKSNDTESPDMCEPSWMSNGAIYELAQSAEITPSEAFEYLRRCHNCGSKLAIFGSVYCKEICQKCCEDSHCDCFWGDSCQVCTSGEFIYWNLLDSTFKPEEYQDELPDELTIYLEDPSQTAADLYAEPEPFLLLRDYIRGMSGLRCFSKEGGKCQMYGCAETGGYCSSHWTRISSAEQAAAIEAYLTEEPIRRQQQEQQERLMKLEVEKSIKGCTDCGDGSNGSRCHACACTK